MVIILHKSDNEIRVHHHTLQQLIITIIQSKKRKSTLYQQTHQSTIQIYQLIISMKISILVLIIIITAILQAKTNRKQDEDHGENEKEEKKNYLSDSQEIKLAERTKKNSVEIAKDTFQAYTFKLKNASDFLIKEEVTTIIKITLDVYWNEHNVYLQAAILKTEEIMLIITELGGKTIIKENFYTANGLKFKAEAGRAYMIQLKQHKHAKRSKLIIMHMTQTKYITKAVKKTRMQKIEAKVSLADRKLQNSYQMSLLGNMLEKSITKEVLNQSNLYCYFQICQTIIVLLFSSFLIKYIKKLLHNDIIV